jgi:hypothetical protein
MHLADPEQLEQLALTASPTDASEDVCGAAVGKADLRRDGARP